MPHPAPTSTPAASAIAGVAPAVAIIMDGNARWAQQRGLRAAEGYRAGTRALRRTVEGAIDAGVESLAVYAFSTENWSRSPEEVDELMDIFSETIERELPDLARQGVRTRFIGRRDRAPEYLRRRMSALEEETGDNARLRLWIAFDYGGRAEIVDAVRRIVASDAAAEDVDEELVARSLYEPDMPDPDLLIRTSGELRISNFLLWQIAYAEFYVTETLWPDFSPEEFRQAIDSYAARSRRRGGV